jgi:hypothetical protein
MPHSNINDRFAACFWTIGSSRGHKPLQDPWPEVLPPPSVSC